AAEPAVRAAPQPLEMAHAILRRADAGEARRYEIVGRVGVDAGRDDREGRDLAEVAVEVGQPECHVRARLRARLGDMRKRHDAPLAPVRGLAVLARGLLVDAP